MTMARRRGADIIWWAILALSGYLAFAYGGSILLIRMHLDEFALFAPVSGWLWIGAVFLYVRFVIGATKPKAWGMWNCTECHFLNAQSAIVCEACGKSYSPSKRKTAIT